MPTSTSPDANQVEEIDWLAMWSTAIYDFDLTEDEFWALTPSRYLALSNRFLEQKQFLDLQFGWSRSMLAEVHRDKKNKPTPFQPKDFMLYPEEEAPKKERVEMTWEQQLDLLKNVVHPTLGGK